MPFNPFAIERDDPIERARHTASVSRVDGLIVEITEETLVGSTREMLRVGDTLRELGARLAVDDVGAGYSGLRQIIEVLPDYLKLDRSLVSDIDSDPDRAALVSCRASRGRRSRRRRSARTSRSSR
jgi:EAL domain-containing protein (putative c-di-GMP-specific phosphodiesterase class I)